MWVTKKRGKYGIAAWTAWEEPPPSSSIEEVQGKLDSPPISRPTATPPAPLGGTDAGNEGQSRVAEAAAPVGGTSPGPNPAEPRRVPIDAVRPLAGPDEGLMEGLHKAYRSPQPYPDKRSVYLRISIEMNRRGVIAPAFRPRVGLPPKGLSAAQVIESNDRQVIDLHWLYCQRRVAVDCDLEFDALFRSEEFDFELAYSLVATNVSARYKALSLGLMALDQFCLASIKTGEAREEERNIKRLLKGLKNKLGAERHQLDIVDRWYALGHAYMILEAAEKLDGLRRPSPPGSAVVSQYRLIVGDKGSTEGALRKQLRKVVTRLK